MRRLMKLATDMLCIKENIYTEEKEFEGISTLENGFRYFNENGRQMLIIYNEESIYTIVERIEGLTVENPIGVYIFSPGNDPWSEEFATIEGKVKLTALPAAIYNAYKRVLPKPKELLVDSKDEVKTEEINEGSNSLFSDEKGGKE